MYTKFLNNVAEFRKLEKLPVKLNLPPPMKSNTFLENKASWHHACFLQFANSKLECAKKNNSKT